MVDIVSHYWLCGYGPEWYSVYTSDLNDQGYYLFKPQELVAKMSLLEVS